MLDADALKGGVYGARVRVRVNTGGSRAFRVGDARNARGRGSDHVACASRGRNARVALRVVVDRHADVRASDQRKRFDAHVASERIGGCVVAVWGARGGRDRKAFFWMSQFRKANHRTKTHVAYSERPKSYDTPRRGAYTAARGAAASARWARLSGVTMVG